MTNQRGTQTDGHLDGLAVAPWCSVATFTMQGCEYALVTADGYSPAVYVWVPTFPGGKWVGGACVPGDLFLGWIFDLLRGWAD